MPIIDQWKCSATAKAAIWKIEEPESFFADATGIQSHIANATRRIEHLAGRFLLNWLEPELNLQQIQVDDHGKPFLPDAPFHFSVSHSFPYVAAIVDKAGATGIDIQTIQPKILRMQHKFLSAQEQILFENDPELVTLAWSAKETVYKWYGKRNLEFIEHLPVTAFDKASKSKLSILFNVNNFKHNIIINNVFYADFVCTYILSAHKIHL